MTRIDPKSLTVGEMAKVEELSGVPADMFEDPSTPKVKLFAALVFVAEKRENPALKWHDVLNRPFGELSEMVGDFDTDDEDEAEAGKDESANSAPKTSRSSSSGSGSRRRSTGS